jgi:hypothetical protein
MAKMTKREAEALLEREHICQVHFIAMEFVERDSKFGGYWTCRQCSLADSRSRHLQIQEAINVLKG